MPTFGPTEIIGLSSLGSSRGTRDVVRDHLGWVVRAFASPIRASSAFVTELWALWYGLLLCASLGLRSLTVELDPLEALRLVSFPLWTDNWEVAYLVQRIRRGLAGLDRFHPAHMYREGNAVADALAYLGAQLADSIFYSTSSLPRRVRHLACLGKCGVPVLCNRRRCDVLRPYVPHIDDIFKDFTSYKFRVPVTGAIILDESYERCLLVKGWKGTSWSFPRGKKNKDEEDHACAIREVLEETGFDVSTLLNREEYIESVFGQQRVRLYIIAGVKGDIRFAPLTKKEISEISWQRLDELIPASNDVISHGVCGVKLYMVAPFLGSLRTWILNHRHQPATTTRGYTNSRGMSVWKAGHGSAGTMAVAVASASITEPQPPPPLPIRPSVVTEGVTWNDMCPGRSFRSFKMDGAVVLQAMDAAFWSH